MSGVRFRALDQLLRVAPHVGKRPPYWRPKPADIDPTMLVEPAWSWAIGVPQADDQVVTLDAIGAFLSAASSVEVAHDALQHTGRVAPDRAAVGYWLVELPLWQGQPIPPPWGSRVLPDGPVCVAHPIMRVLLDLADLKDPPCSPPEVIDSWLGAVPMRLRRWTDVVKAARLDAIHAADPVMYQAVKDGYSQAVTMMVTGEGSKVHRPDWGHAIRGQHAATFWWKAWKGLRAGYAPLGLANTDELAILRHHGHAILGRQAAKLEVPFVIDVTGQRLGAFKPKGTFTADEWARITNEPTNGGAQL